MIETDHNLVHSNQHDQVDRLNRLLTSLYGCVENEKGFTLFLNDLLTELKLHSVALICSRSDPIRSVHSWTSGYPKGLVKTLLKTKLVFKDEAIIKALENTDAGATSFSDCHPDYNIIDHLSLFSKSWAKPIGLIDSASISFSQNHNQQCMLVLNRQKQSGVFSALDLSLLDRLEPHIKQAINLFETLKQRQTDAESIHSAIEHMPNPVAIYSSLGKLLTCNRQFENLGLKYSAFHINTERQQIIFTDTQLHQDFLQSLSMLIIESDHEKEPQTHFILTDKKPLKISLRPMLSNENVVKSVIIEIKDSNQKVELKASDIQSILQCSKSEANVLNQLTQGKTIEETADILNRSVHTIRSNVKAVMMKNNYNRREDVVADIIKFFD